MTMPARHCIAPLGVACLLLFGQAAVHAVPVVGPETGGRQIATAAVYATVRDEVGTISTQPEFRTAATPAAAVSGINSVSTGGVESYVPGSTGGTLLPGVAAVAAGSGTRAFEGEPVTPWSVQATGIASALTGRIELHAEGVQYRYASWGAEWMAAGSEASGKVFNSFFPQFSREVAATLQTVPQYLILTATLTGRTTTPGQVTGSLYVASDYGTRTGEQRLDITVDTVGEWTRQYQMQYQFTTLPDLGGTNCLREPAEVTWIQCRSAAVFDASFNLYHDVNDDIASDLSVLLSWSVPDNVLTLYTDAANWGAPLAVDLPGSTVPEPGSAAMVLLGLGALAAVQGRRRPAGATRHNAR